MTDAAAAAGDSVQQAPSILDKVNSSGYRGGGGERGGSWQNWSRYTPDSTVATPSETTNPGGFSDAPKYSRGGDQDSKWGSWGGGGGGSQWSSSRGGWGDSQSQQQQGGGGGGWGNRGGGSGGWGSRGGGWGNGRQGGGQWNSGGRGNGAYEMGRGFDRDLPAINWATVKTKEFKKDFYKEAPSVTARSDIQNRQLLNQNGISITDAPDPRKVPKMITSFDESGLDPSMIEALHAKFPHGTPTKIQMQGWPTALSGYDMIGVAETGSGKTLGYLLPGIMHAMHQEPMQRGDGPIILCLVPTRELARQIHSETQSFCKTYEEIKARKEGCRLTPFQSVCVYGGEPKREQTWYLCADKPPDMVVATPGRLFDFLGEGSTNLQRVTYLVLDEADQMLDRGFGKQLEAISRVLRSDRQTLMWSATWPPHVKQMADFFFRKDYIKIVVGGGASGMADTLSRNYHSCQNVKQSVKKVLTPILDAVYYDNMEKADKDLVLIFCNTKRIVDDLTGRLRRGGYTAVCIHSDMDQKQRNWVFDSIKSKKEEAYILVATQILGRGIDLPQVRYVINYDMPHQIEDYVHRIGRTGRGGNKGEAISFVTNDDVNLVPDLIAVMQEANAYVPQEVRDLSRAQQMSGSLLYGNAMPAGFE